MKNSYWVIIANTTDPKNVDLIEYVRSVSDNVKVFANYGTMRAFVRASGISEDGPIAFCDGYLVGDIDKVRKYILRIIHLSESR